MVRVFITGSSDGIGAVAARYLINSGHEVYLHARSAERASQARAALPKASGVLIGDLTSLSSTRALAKAADEHGPFDAIVHNAGIGYNTGVATKTADGLAALPQVNVVAPYMLVGLMKRPTQRMLFMSSGLHRSGSTSTEDMLWAKREMDHMQAYNDSKLHDVWLAFALARRWKDGSVVAMDPGWVVTKMGGRSAMGSADLPGRIVAEWAEGKLLPGKTGVYMDCHGLKDPAPGAHDEAAQDKLLAVCAEASGVTW